MPTYHTQSRPVASWIAWHATELAALTVPVVLAITVTGWAWLLAVAVAVAWVAHEAHQHCRDRRARHEIPALASAPEHPNHTTEPTAESTATEARHG